MKTALFPGSFDPFTIGHKNIIDRSLNLFDLIIIGIAKNVNKPERYFSIEITKKSIEEIYSQ